MERWCGRVTIVTGASGGIGAAIARLLVENGMRVVGVDLNVQKLQILAGELSECKGDLHGVEGDVTKEEDVVRVVKWTRDNLGGAHVLVNNAGVFIYTPLSEVKAEDIRTTYEVNVLGLCLFTREVVKDMRDRGVDDGHIFHIGSIAGQQISPNSGVHLYATSKHAVRVMTEGLRRELRDFNTKIRVTEISPSTVKTGIFEASGFMTAERAAQMFENSPCLEPIDVANALLYALSTPPHVQVHEIMIRATGTIA